MCWFFGLSCFGLFFFFSSRRRHTRFSRDWSSDVCSSDLSDQTTHLGYRTARKAVLEALSQKTTLLMEVTPGGIDYTPALLPVLEWLSDASIETQPGRSEERRVGKDCSIVRATES